MKHLLSFAVALTLTSTASAQRGGYNPHKYYYDHMQYDNSILSVFSENGEPFFLVLNGVTQNDRPVSKIRVEALPRYRNDIRILLANDMYHPIVRTVDISDPISGRAVNLTLRISRNRRGTAQLLFHRMTECDRDYRGPRDEYVMYYGKPQQVNTVTETTYMDPITGQWVTETTTTTTDQYSNGNGGGRGNGSYGRDRGRDRDNAPPPPPPPAGPVAMDSRSFGDAKAAISNASFENTKLSTAKTILGTNFVTTDQVMEVCQLFSFENTKLTFAKFAYDRTIDQQNYYKVASVLSFDSNKKALNDFIRRSQR